MAKGGWNSGTAPGSDAKLAWPADQHLPWGRGGAGVGHEGDPGLDEALCGWWLVEAERPLRTGPGLSPNCEIIRKHVSMRVNPLSTPRRPGMEACMVWQKWVDAPVFPPGMPEQPQAAKTRA